MTSPYEVNFLEVRHCEEQGYGIGKGASQRSNCSWGEKPRQAVVVHYSRSNYGGDYEEGKKKKKAGN